MHTELPNDVNEHIARWMGEWAVDGLEYIGPDYDTDPAAALRVLARMADKLDILMRPSYGRWVVFIQRATHPHGHFERDTPCASIVAAWWAEFGGES